MVLVVQVAFCAVLLEGSSWYIFAISYTSDNCLDVDVDGQQGRSLSLPYTKDIPFQADHAVVEVVLEVFEQKEILMISKYQTITYLFLEM